MSEPLRSNVETWELMVATFLVVAVLIVFGKLFWEPTHNAVKRIESMNPCKQIEVTK